MQIEALIERIAPGSTLVSMRPLAGGVSAQVTALELRHPDGTTEQLVVRQPGTLDHARNPNIARDEFWLLERLHAAGIRVPTPRWLDATAEIFETPAIVTELVAGAAGFPSEIDPIPQFAAELARLHRLDLAQLDAGFLPRLSDGDAARVRPPAIAAGSLEARAWEVVRSAWPSASRNPETLLHGDFWPGNTLWQDGRLAAVLDWEDAARGDPLADLANSRLEVVWAAGECALARFTQEYIARNPLDTTQLPLWDLYAALRPAANLGRWGLAADVEHAMRAQLRGFIAAALEALGPH